MTDLSGLVRLFTLADEIESVRAVIARDGWTVTKANGDLANHPAVVTYKALLAEHRAYEDRFLMSPVARLRNGATNEPRPEPSWLEQQQQARTKGTPSDDS
ncbi:MAG: P27 family phage terminase small subunit [Actinomycetota bacterium]